MNAHTFIRLPDSLRKLSHAAGMYRFCLAVVGLAMFAASNCFAQSAGDACTAGQVSGPDSLGQNLICSGSVFVAAGIATLDGSGAANHIPYWSDGNSLTYDNNQLYWNATTNRLGIGTADPGSTLEVAGTVSTSELYVTNNRIKGLVQGTILASTSGTSIEWTDVPSWVKRINLVFNGVSSNGTSNIIIQIGTGGSYVTTGYTGTVSTQAGTVAAMSSSNGFAVINGNSASYSMNGLAVLLTPGSNIWAINSVLGGHGTSIVRSAAGTLSLGGTIDRIRVTTLNGTDTFDAGSIGIIYE